MTISVGPETQKLLEEKLKTGEYKSPEEVVHAALEALNQLDEFKLDEQALADIERAEEEIDRSECHDWKDVRERVRKTFLGKQP